MRAIAASLFAVFMLVACGGQEEQVTPTAAVVAPAGGGGPTPGSVEEFVQVVGDRVFFGFDRSDLSGEARTTLEGQAQWLQQYPNVTVQIEGHADERGTRAYNLALGERRATAARNYLVALGIPASRITTISYGKERPAVLGSNEAAWGQNRRAVTVIVSGAPTS